MPGIRGVALLTAFSSCRVKVGMVLSVAQFGHGLGGFNSRSS